MITPATRAVLLMASVVSCYQPTIPSSTLRSSRRYPKRTPILYQSASRERTRYDRSRNSGRGRPSNNHYGGDRGRENAYNDKAEQYDDAFGDYDDTFDNTNTNNQYDPSAPQMIGLSPPEEKASTFYSRKSITDPSFSSDPHFQHLCTSAGITRPSRIQSLAWPVLSRGENAIVADQTGSGKTFAYLLPLLQRLYEDDKDESVSQLKKKRTGTPRILVLTPTAELADQIHAVCTSLSATMGDDGWNFNPFVTTATGSQNTNIRDQIRLLRSTPVDVLISTPGRLATILRTKNAGLDLSMVKSMVLDEVDFLLVDETFGPQLRTVGVAVTGGVDNEDISADDKQQPQFLFVTATLPEDVLESIQTEFPDVIELRGPGLHRITPTVHQTLVDVSVPPEKMKDEKACFNIKLNELYKSLRSRRTAKTLIFCNTVETCRSVENALKRKDKKSKINRIWAYHNALSADARLKNLQSFSHDSNGGESTEHILVCTDRAARGIDFDSSPVDHVVLFDFPKDPAEYVRRVGRTARAGRAGASTVFAYGWQLPIAREIMYGKGKKKKGGKLEKFTMMKSSDGWHDDELDKEDEYYVKGGARTRKEISAGERGPERKTGRWKKNK
eukprot:scaffold4172_cov67-Cyclotella_meneghiniana.AAC.8